MPHLLLEFSANLLEKAAIKNVLAECNQLTCELVASDINNSKARAVEYSTYCIGGGLENGAFLHLNIRVLSGREVAVLKETSQQLCALLEKRFIRSADALDLQISVDIGELEDSYVKFRSK